MNTSSHARTTWVSWHGVGVFWLAAIGSAAIVALRLEGEGHSRVVSALLGAAVDAKRRDAHNPTDRSPPVTQRTIQERVLVVILRLAGGVTVTAFVAMFLPVERMADTHEWLGLGEFPRAPIVDYLTRSIAALYGFHGILVLIVSFDPVRYRTLLLYLGIMNVLFGAIVLIIDLRAGMPPLWTLGEGPPVAVFGLLILYLVRSVPRGQGR